MEEEEGSLFVNGDLGFVPLVEKDLGIHGDYIDEGAGEEDIDFSSSAECSDWRKSAEDFRNEGMVNRPDFSRFFTNDWRTARVAAKHLKFCPGDKCRQWLALHNFSANNNMSDKLDVYCIQCNQTKRNERLNRYRIPSKITRERSTDKYEMFVKAYREKEPPKSAEHMKEEAIFREVGKRIEEAADVARKRYRKRFSVEKTEISRKLFQGGKHICNITGQILTPECFLEHHTLTFQLNKETKRIEIICSQSRRGTPPKEFNGFN